MVTTNVLILIITASQQHLRKFLLLPRTGNNCLTSTVRSLVIATSYNNKCCCEVLIMWIGKFKLQSDSFAIPLQSFLTLSLLSPPEALSHNPRFKRFPEMWGNCLGIWENLPPFPSPPGSTSLMRPPAIVWKSHSERDPSPSTTPLMGTLK